jgi:serine/threonine protein kinase
MNPETWKQIQELFERVSEAPDSERDAILTGADASPEVRARVESMLRHADDETELDGEPASKLSEVIQIAMNELAHAPLGPGSRIGRYSIVRLVASGGMGDVYLAHSAEGELEIPVAIKVSREVGAHPRTTDRFAFEREVLLRLDHAAIPKILDTGTTPDGLSYFAMEYVDGQPIDQYCQSQSESPRDRILLVRKICDAIHHAHQRLVIHRDIKPSNILVRKDGSPRVLDFGIASDVDRAMDHARLTRTGEFVGTLAYASPEQLDGASTPDTRSDVYSLGVVLYELLTESLPHAKTTSLPMLLDQIRTTRPPSPSTVKPSIDQDLSAVVMRAIALDPGRRYQSVADFGADLQNYLEDRPVHAREDSRWYVIRSEIRLRRVPIMIALVVLFVSVAFSIYASTQSRMISNRNIALVDALSRESVERAGLLAQTGSLISAERLLWPLHQEGSDRATWALRDLYTRFPVSASSWLHAPPKSVSVIDGHTILIGDESTGTFSSVDLLESRTEVLRQLDDALTFNIKDDLVVWVTNDGSVHATRLGTTLQDLDFGRVDIPSEEVVVGVQGPDDLPWIHCDGGMWMYQQEDKNWTMVAIGVNASILQVQPTDAGFVILTDDLRIRSLDASGREKRSVESAPIGRSRTSIIATADERMVAQITDSDIAILNQDWPDPNPIQGANGWIEAACFVQRDRGPLILVACSADNLLRAWRLDTTELILECNAFDSTPTHVLAVPGEHGFVTIEESGLIRAWDLGQMSALHPSTSRAETALSLEIDPSTEMVTMGFDGSPHRFQLLEQETQSIVAQMSWHAPVCATARGREPGTWFFADYEGGIVRVQRHTSGLEQVWHTTIDQRPNAIALSPDGDFVAIACDQGVIDVLSASDGTPHASFVLDAIRVPSLVWDPIRNMIVACTYPESDLISITDPTGTADVRTMFDGDHQLGARTVAMSSDGNQIALSGDDALIRVWNVPDQGELGEPRTLRDHSEGLFTLEFSTSGRMLVSAGRSGRVIVWDARTGEPLARIDASERMLFSAKMSDNERSILAAGIGGRIYRWDLDSLDERIRLHNPNRRDEVSRDDWSP